jgi:hypothetical protein
MTEKKPHDTRADDRASEFLRLARSKAFIIGILLMPVLFGVMMLFTVTPNAT